MSVFIVCVYRYWLSVFPKFLFGVQLLAGCAFAFACVHEPVLVEVDLYGCVCATTAAYV